MIQRPGIRRGDKNISRSLTKKNGKSIVSLKEKGTTPWEAAEI
jgi:hypothetical protein